MSEIRAHQLAKAAFERVQSRADKAFSASQKPYATLAHKLPVLILQHGLAQATGFLLAKGKPEHLALLDDLAAVLAVCGGGQADNQQAEKGGGKALHQRIIAADTGGTMLLTRQALDASGWLKRYVQGVLKLGATGDAQSSSAQEVSNDAVSQK